MAVLPDPFSAPALPIKWQNGGEGLGTRLGEGLRVVNVVDSQTNTTFQTHMPSSAEAVTETIAFKGDEPAHGCVALEIRFEMEIGITLLRN